jgi:hypothetical protein
VSLLAKLSSRTWPQPSEPAQPDLEQLLIDLTAFGRPRMFMADDGTWLAAIDMNTTSAGAKFEVKSDFKHTNPRDAVVQLAERVRAAVAQIGGKA